MTSILSGWLGYGSAVTSSGLAEPSDPVYARRPVSFGTLDAGRLVDIGSGTVGPAGVGWGQIGFAGIFDQPTGGNLLLWLPLPAPVVVAAGTSVTSPPGALTMSVGELRSSGSSRSWPPGVVVATMPDGRSVISGVPLQYASGTISAQSSLFGTTVTMAALPQTQPTAGTGQLWNNGGVISVA